MFSKGMASTGLAPLAITQRRFAVRADVFSPLRNMHRFGFPQRKGMELTDVYAAVIHDFPYRAGVHVHYQETVLPIKDGLPKMRDLPGEMGGSGIRMEE